VTSELNSIKDKLLSEIAPEAIVIIDFKGVILYINQSFERLFGYSPAEAIGKSIAIIQPPELMAHHVRGLERYLHTGERKLDWNSTRTRGRHQSGREFSIEISFSHVKLKGTDFFAAFIRDISEIVAQESKIKEQHQTLIQKNTELDNFTYRISHDLRAPLLSILGLVNVYKICNTPEEQLDVVNKIEKSVKKLDLFIREVIHISKNDWIAIAPEKIDFASLFSEVKEELRYLESERKIDVYSEIKDQSAAYFEGDRYRLKIVLTNLVGNAIKYYHRHQTQPFVRVSIARIADSIVLRVEDNGIGMSQSVMDNIFNMFYRGTDLSEGSGLGLYIVKEMVNKMKGEISVSSQIEKGSTFTVSIPSHA
jgi:PAS domain S-box-containing protein